MSYDKSQVQAAGAQFIITGFGLADGIDLTDGTNGMSLLNKIMGAADEFKEDRDAAIFDMLSGGASKFADLRADGLPGYNKVEAQAVGVQMVGTGFGVADGIDMTDGANAMDLMTKFMAAANEFKMDPDAAMLDAAAGAFSELADRRRNTAPDPSTPTS